MAAAIGAQLSPEVDPEAVVTGLTIDSRQAGPGTAFVALPGARRDGADFVADAIGRGAPLAIAGRAVAGPVALVEDPVAALGQLAEVALRRAREANPALRVVAITGSVGKTTTKDLLARITSAQGPTVAAEGSLNNHLGVPLTVARVGADTDFLILEMGANHEGEIARLAQIAPADVGVVLGVSNAHIGEFGSLDAIARAKTELLRGLAHGGVSVLNTTDRVVGSMAFEAPGQVMTFGLHELARIAGYDMDTNPRGHLSLTVEDHDTNSRCRVRTKLTGEHLGVNVVAAMAAAAVLGIPLDQSAAALLGAEAASPHRMAVWRLPNRLTLVDDSYNASPESMLAAIRTVGDLARSAEQPAFAVIAPMAELGGASLAAHRAAGEALAEEGFERVVVVGEAAREVYWGARVGGLPEDAVELRPTIEGLEADIRRWAGPGHLLLKGSHGAELWRVAQALTEGLEPGNPDPVPAGDPYEQDLEDWAGDPLGDWI
ncbi:MAG: UDP-N-acetylmuramoyl-tripeptide--D-alanyl-D-alanine ligase [Bifidobacteriaceae bacterium]|nr:UDP-N-acetylmuramoyl-tripeptide--D-alanyl-D-alanine ligase [Bifidobacteriaceae bacterium]